MTAPVPHPLKGHIVLTRQQRLAWAHGVRMDIADHSDARIRRACRIFLAEARAGDHAERAWAEQMLRVLPTGAKR